MRYLAIQRVLGALLMLFSLTMLPPAAVSVYFADGQLAPFMAGLAATFTAGLLAWLTSRTGRRELRLRDGFIVAAMFWIGLAVFAAIPFLLSGNPAMSVTDAFFETVSGLTTTGATALTGLDHLPRSVLFYRAQLQWLGGMGVIVLAVAVLPMLGVGGMQLYQAEAPGPLKDRKLTPRITETAKALWLIYFALTIICTAAYALAGMSIFDAVCHGMTTIATGGFSTHDASIGWFDSPLIEAICMAGMLVSAINYSLHFLAFRRLQFWMYGRDPEFRAYLRVVAGLCIFVVANLLIRGHYPEPTLALRDGLFLSVSVMTSSGFTTGHFVMWPGSLPVLLILASFIGGCGGSTAGGMKLIRWLLLYNQGAREVQRLIHPHAELPVKLGGSVVPQRVVDAIWGYCVVYIILFGIMFLALLATDMDQVSAFAAIASSMNNLGPGLGDVAANFTGVEPLPKWICMIAMFLGRLEVFTLLVLISPSFWRF